MSDPFLPPQTPSERPYLAPPVWTPPPPPPPKKGHKLRNGLLIGGGVVAAIVVISVIAAPDATKQGFEDGLGVGNTTTTIVAPEATQAPIVTLAEVPETTVTTVPKVTVPAWMEDPLTARWASEIQSVINQTVTLSQDMSDALSNTDVAEAASIAVQLQALWAGAPEIPDGVPVSTEYNALKSSAVDAFGTLADGLITMDAEKMAQANAKVKQTTALLTTFTDSLNQLTDDINAM